MPQFAANLSMLYTELPFLDHFEAAAADGFEAVEFLFPYAWAPAEIAARLRGNGLQQVLFNAPAGGVDAASSVLGTVTEQADGMIIEGPTKVSPTKSIRSYGDHRVAMSMSILAIFADQPVTIANVACVDTSYPEFWEQLSQLGVKVE